MAYIQGHVHMDRPFFEVVDFTVSYAPVVGIKLLRIIIAIISDEGLIILTWTSPTPSKILFYPT